MQVMEEHLVESGFYDDQKKARVHQPEHTLSDTSMRELLTRQKVPEGRSLPRRRPCPLDDKWHILFLGNPFLGEERSGGTISI